MTIKLPRPFKEWYTYPDHVGIDYPEPDDRMVLASGNGRVTFSGWFSDKAGYGVSVDYGNGVIHSYKHSDKNDWRASVGTQVKLGDKLMEIGGTGQGSTGPHLHHEVFVNDMLMKGNDYWELVDKSENGYVGAPSSADSGSKPFPDNDEDEEMTNDNAGFYYKRKSDNTRVNLIVNTKSGWWFEYLNTTTIPQNSNNAVAASFDVTSYAEVEESFAIALKKSLPRAQGVAVSGQLTIAE